MKNLNNNLTSTFIIYADGRRLDTEHEGAVKSIKVVDLLNGIASFSIIFDSSKVDLMEKGQITHESEVSIHLGYKDDIEEVFFGEVTAIKKICPENGFEQIEVIGNSFLQRLDHSGHFRTFENKKPSEIIKGLIESYSLKAEVDDFGTPHEIDTEERISDYDYLVKETDYHGKLFYADGNTVYVKNEITARKDEVIFEWGKSLIKFESAQNTNKLVNGIDFTGWDPLNNESFIYKCTLDDIPVKIGGENNWTKIAKSSANRYIINEVNMNIQDTEEAKQLAQGLLQKNSDLFYYATGKGEGNYKLRPGMRVMIKMTGEQFEGEYLACVVTHNLSKETGYITEFELRRNMFSGEYKSNVNGFVDHHADNAIRNRMAEQMHANQQREIDEDARSFHVSQDVSDSQFIDTNSNNENDSVLPTNSDEINQEQNKNLENFRIVYYFLIKQGVTRHPSGYVYNTEIMYYSTNIGSINGKRNSIMGELIKGGYNNPSFRDIRDSITGDTHYLNGAFVTTVTEIKQERRETEIIQNIEEIRIK